MKKRILGILIALLLIPINAKAEDVDFVSQGFVKMRTTAYCMGTITASGKAVNTSCASVNRERMGMCAIVYTTEGSFIGNLDCCDTGSANGIVTGKVIDVYRPTYQQCKNYMALTQGWVWVKFIEAEG